MVSKVRTKVSIKSRQRRCCDVPGPCIATRLAGRASPCTCHLATPPRGSVTGAQWCSGLVPHLLPIFHPPSALSSPLAPPCLAPPSPPFRSLTRSARLSFLDSLARRNHVTANVSVQGTPSPSGMCAKCSTTGTHRVLLLPVLRGDAVLGAVVSDAGAVPRRPGLWQTGKRGGVGCANLPVLTAHSTKQKAFGPGSSEVRNSRLRPGHGAKLPFVLRLYQGEGCSGHAMAPSDTSAPTLPM